MTETEIEEIISESLWDADEDHGIGIADISTYRDVGMLSNNAGLVIKVDDGSEYQITIVQSKDGNHE